MPKSDTSSTTRSRKNKADMEVDEDSEGEVSSDEEQVGCIICNGLQSTPKNLIVYCDGKECYGIEKVPPGDEKWFCQRCEDHIPVDATKAICCPETKGAFQRTNVAGEYIHAICALYNVNITTGSGPVTVAKWLLDKQECYICKAKTGLTIKCGNPNCKKYFHVTCAVNADIITLQSPKNIVTEKLRCDEHKTRSPPQSSSSERSRRASPSTGGKPGNPVRKRKRIISETSSEEEAELSSEDDAKDGDYVEDSPQQPSGVGASSTGGSTGRENVRKLPSFQRSGSAEKEKDGNTGGGPARRGSQSTNRMRDPSGTSGEGGSSSQRPGSAPVSGANASSTAGAGNGNAARSSSAQSQQQPQIPSYSTSSPAASANSSPSTSAGTRPQPAKKLKASDNNISKDPLSALLGPNGTSNTSSSSSTSAFSQRFYKRPNSSFSKDSSSYSSTSSSSDGMAHPMQFLTRWLADTEKQTRDVRAMLPKWEQLLKTNGNTDSIPLNDGTKSRLDDPLSSLTSTSSSSADTAKLNEQMKALFTTISRIESMEAHSTNVLQSEVTRLRTSNEQLRAERDRESKTLASLRSNLVTIFQFLRLPNVPPQLQPGGVGFGGDLARVDEYVRFLRDVVVKADPAGVNAVVDKVVGMSGPGGNGGGGPSGGS
ncbi:nuA3 HAT complex component nto1 [Quaeritorhiza haematococci]|nr:nuA3 HAT complex component nto1 [Quaeritorhiza haematococci]